MKFRNLLSILGIVSSLYLGTASGEEIIYRGDRKSKQIALTFDCESSKKYDVRRLLKKLEDKNVKATFFVTGKFVERHKDDVKRIAIQGHSIENHSYSHPDFTKLSDYSIKEEIEKTNRLIYETTGKKAKFWRPPYGSFDAGVLNKVEELGEIPVYWTFDTQDWRIARNKNWKRKFKERSEDKLYRLIHGGRANGEIVLMHLNLGIKSYERLPAMIDNIKRRGYKLVTLDEMIAKQ